MNKNALSEHRFTPSPRQLFQDLRMGKVSSDVAVFLEEGGYTMAEWRSFFPQELPENFLHGSIYADLLEQQWAKIMAYAAMKNGECIKIYMVASPIDTANGKDIDFSGNLDLSYFRFIFSIGDQAPISGSAPLIPVQVLKIFPAEMLQGCSVEIPKIHSVGITEMNKLAQNLQASYKNLRGLFGFKD